MPRISVLMTCYNSSATILAAVESVQKQSFSDWELIVIDDGSSDNSVEIINAVPDARLKLLTQSNSGWPAARNFGLRVARGEFLAFLDSDDTWHPEFLHKMLEALDPKPDAPLAYCGWQNLGIDGGRGKPFVPPDYNLRDRAESLLGGCRWPIHGALIRKTVMDAAKGFDSTFKASADYDLWLRIALRGPLVRVPEVLAYYHHHGGDQITKNKLRGALNHHKAQLKFLEANPDEARRLGKKKVRDLVTGELLRRGYACYWARDLPAARCLFRKVMLEMYGTPRDWVYMLPSLLPLPVHEWMLHRRDDVKP